MSSSEELQSLLNELSSENVELPDDKVIEFRKKLNPYGRTIEGSDRLLNFSFTNLREKYLIKFITTSMVGFLNRLNDEWLVPRGVPVIPVYEYLENPSSIEIPEAIRNNPSEKIVRDYAINAEMMKKRVIVKEFLETVFQYNPDEHVRSGYRPNLKDKSRGIPDTTAANAAINNIKGTDKDFRVAYEAKKSQGALPVSKPVDHLKVTKKARVIIGRDGKKRVIKTHTTVQSGGQSTGQSGGQSGGETTQTSSTQVTSTEAVSTQVTSGQDQSTVVPMLANPVTADKDPVVLMPTMLTRPQDDLSTEHMEKKDDLTLENMRTSDTLVDTTLHSTVTSIIPPHDYFGNFGLYMRNNYEELQKAVHDLYCETPDWEMAINPYSWHDSEEDAEKFKKKHSDEVITEIFTAHSGKWNFFSPFKQVRESTNYYTDQTIVLEEMMKQLERDEKLGMELMRNNVRKAKAENVLEEGPDDPAFVKWSKQNSELAKMGAKHVGQVSDEDVPKDAIQCDVWKVAKGGLEMKRDRFFTKAVAPSVPPAPGAGDSEEKKQ